MKIIVAVLLVLFSTGAALADSSSLADTPARIALSDARFALGDDPARSRIDFDDRSWKIITTTDNYENQGFGAYDGWSWYRIHVTIPSTLKNSVHWQQRLRIYLSSIDDVDETFLNGTKIGQTGRLPDDADGYDTKWQAFREYFVDLTTGLVRWDADNVIAIRVYDGSGGGGFYRHSDQPYLNMAEIVDGVQLDTAATTDTFSGPEVISQVVFINAFPAALAGTLSYAVFDAATRITLSRHSQRLALTANGSETIAVRSPQRAGIQVRFRFTETTSGKSMTATRITPYLLTPAEGQRPRINGARVIGVHPGSPFLFRVPATGRAPLSFAAANLPDGLTIESHSGIIAGKTARPGDYKVSLSASNAIGAAQQVLTIRVGETLALTPPMGWNSWNVYGLGVNAARVRETAAAMVTTGLAAHGWSYINIDDGWEADSRAADGSIQTNAKFPDMAALSASAHELGLKLGIYSSPGPLTCGRFLGSLDHERQDADSYARWGIDYLKYDLCSYEDRMSSERTLAEHRRPYEIMGAALRAQPRDIVYSLCQYGNREVWKWGGDVGGNSWRIGGDIEDTWKSMLDIISRQDVPAPFARAGHWNDPDMLVIGRVGWGGTLHPSRLTPDEQYSHISLWALLAAPLLLGNDLTRLDAFTRNLLTNDEVIAVDQDPRGSAARQLLDHDGWQVWARDLADGSKAVGVFNFGEQFRTLPLDMAALHLPAGGKARDLWRQKELGPLTKGFVARVPTHGVLLLGVRAK